ncbi:MAG: galactose-1-phosphate uridylyltransferase, partial [Terriglobales bacterium]
MDLNVDLNRPHRRFNPLTQDWVLVSPLRLQRPWQGQVEGAPAAPPPAYDPGCYLCPGNARAGGQVNPNYAGPFVFGNDFPSLRDEPLPAETAAGLLQAAPERGVCRVVCFSPRHDWGLARLPQAALEAVVTVWAEQAEELSAQFPAVTVFENRGAMMGASNPHPHGQIWANSSIPNQLQREREAFSQHEHAHGRCLLCEYLELELRRGERLVCANEDFVALVPWWAYWPFETLVLGRRHESALVELPPHRQAALADILKRLNIRYDNLFQAPFPAAWGFHPAPAGAPRSSWHLHAHFYPPLLR